MEAVLIRESNKAKDKGKGKAKGKGKGEDKKEQNENIQKKKKNKEVAKLEQVLEKKLTKIVSDMYNKVMINAFAKFVKKIVEDENETI